MSGRGTSEEAFIKVALAKPALKIERRANGELLLRSGYTLDSYPAQLSDHLRHWARVAPERTFLAERSGNGAWRKLSYGEARESVDSISRTLLQREHSAARPVACLSDNSISVALLALGAMQVGIPFLPISSAYSLMSETHDKLMAVVEAFRPSLIYVSNVTTFSAALRKLNLSGVDLVGENCDAAWSNLTPFSALLASRENGNLGGEYAKIGPSSVAKILLTSGSTGMPKGVINTQAMMGADGVGIDQLWPFLKERPPKIIDWLPWNHTFGSNFNFNIILRNGGTMYIDAGKPVSGRFQTTIDNLRSVQPTLLFNVPRGFDMLIPVLESDDAFAHHLFEKLDVIFYAGAALPEHLRGRLNALSLKCRGNLIPILSALGSTETAPVATLSHWCTPGDSGIGLPLPGVTIKLVPEAGTLEMRVSGELVTPGYYLRPDLTKEAFDDEGFFKLGDAVAFVDPDDPSRGLVFDGRLSENFKLLSGTWVQVGDLRLSLLSGTAPIVQDLVVVGENREDICLLVFLNAEICAGLCGLPNASLEDLAGNQTIRNQLRDALVEFNRMNTGSSRRIARALIQIEPPSIDGGEITDKGYLNQRAILSRRASLVECLYDGTSHGDVIFITRQPYEQGGAREPQR
ncbi:feruloyl-CoA synthase [Mesorhizobium sp.]|uniref:feruloyl-CoA synthase n=1 Tax=Mesorhizobium sp. TaxID=1871066 RepID=UPI0025CF4E43|nr:feruloyl-CoA synthase [Mesorhizobium sp.]